MTFLRLTATNGKSCVVRLDLIQAVQDGWIEMKRNEQNEKVEVESTRVFFKDGAMLDIKDSADEVLALIAEVVK